MIRRPALSLGAVLLVGATALPLGGCGFVGLPTCDADDDVVHEARALPQPVLAALYEEAEGMSRAGMRSGKAVATALPGLHADDRLWFQMFGRTDARVRLRYCFDHGVVLWFHDLGTAEGRVMLKWGEGPTAGEQVLWRKPAATTTP